MLRIFIMQSRLIDYIGVEIREQRAEKREWDSVGKGARA